MIEVAAGDSFGGATPPISNFFGDKPTLPIMNMMGIDVDALGNHSFDRGQAYLRTELIPLAKFPMLSANVVDPDGKTPEEWSPSTVFDFGHGVEGRRRRLHDRVDARDRLPGQPRSVPGPARSSRRSTPRRRGSPKEVDAIVAIGHEGATRHGRRTRPARSSTSPTASRTSTSVIGDHNDLQVDALRPNGVLVTENRGKGIRFTRMRLVIGPGKEGVVYKTADFHKPWNIGMTPDAAIQAKIDELNAQLAPILGTQIGSSTKCDPARRPVRRRRRPDLRVARRRTWSPTRCGRRTARSASSSRSRTPAACAPS